MKSYLKKDDQIVLPLIKKVLERRPTYGYKRVTVMVNHVLKDSKKEKINKKRIYRIMKNNGLLLPKNQIQRTNHKGTGKIVTLHSNTRWCSDDSYVVS